MATVHLWLKDLFEGALTDYLNDTQPSLEGRLSRFAYELENSNLRIWLLAPQHYDLTITEVYRPSTFFRGTLCDGQYSIPFLSPDQRIHEQIQAAREGGYHTTPFRALVESVELRVSDCFDPPKVEAYVNGFHNIEKLDINQAVHLVSPLSAASSVVELLRRYVETKSSAESDDEMSSPGSIKSQPSPVHLSEGYNAAVSAGSVDSSPISQIHLATQAPMLAASQILRRPLGELERNISRQLSAKFPSANAPNPGHKLSRPAPGEEIASAEVVQKKAEHKEDTPDQRRSAQDQSHLLAVTTASRKQEVPAEADLPPARELTEPLISALDVTREQQTDADMQVKFRQWRLEASAGRYIPRRACKISKQQLDVLASDEKWQPPLPGRDKRPGTVPIDLLNELTAKADEAVKQPEPITVPDPTARAGDEALVEPEPELSDDTASSQELGPSQWSPSPERGNPAHLLPPDSSLSSPDYRNKEPLPSEASVNESGSEQGDANDHSVASLQASKPSENRATDIPMHSQSEARPTRRSPSHLKPQPGEKLKLASNTRQSVTSSGDSDLRMLRKIQVSETPFPGKTMQPGRVDQVSGIMRDLRQCPDPSFVPSTYLEGTPINLQESRKRTNLQQQASGAGEVRQQTSKRKAVGAETATSMKRAKVEAADCHTQQFDPAFAPVFQDIREYRRQALKPLTKESRRQNMARPSISGSSDRTTEQSIASRQDLPSEALNGVARLPQASTPLTVPSSRPTSKNGLRGAFATVSTFSSVTGSVVPQPLFEKFLATYVDYQGEKAYFDTAVTLLRQLRLSRSDPHPSLYDDFVWHQYHSYLPYALTSVENPLSCNAYYNQCIESPSHFAKVITPADLDQLSTSKPDCEQVCLSDDLSAKDLRNAGQVKGAIHSRNSISSVALAPAPVEDRLDEQREVPQGDSEQPLDPMDPSQKSSVETWLEGTARAASPDLGTPEDVQPAKSPSVVEMPPPKPSSSQHAPSKSSLAPHSTKRNKKRLSASPFAQTLKSVAKQTAGQNHENLTPFKRWAKAIMSLPSEKLATSTAQKPVRAVNIFAWR